MFSPNADPFSRHLVRIEHQELWQKIEADRLYITDCLSCNSESKGQSVSSIVDYIAKPFASRTLVDSIKRVFARLDGSEAGLFEVNI